MKPKAKFRIIKRNNKFIAQQFIGFWIFGIYFDLSYETSFSPINIKFEHEDIKDAESIIQRTINNYKTKKYIVKEYK